jgi:cell division control protein 11
VLVQEQLQGPIEKTNQPYTISREIHVDNKERIVLTLIDTPGFSAEYLVDKQLHDIIKYIEHQFDLTLAEVIIFNILSNICLSYLSIFDRNPK